MSQMSDKLNNYFKNTDTHHLLVVYHRSLPLVLPFDLLSSVSTRQLTELKFCKLKILPTANV